jgi:hypothetical protein
MTLLICGREKVRSASAIASVRSGTDRTVVQVQHTANPDRLGGFEGFSYQSKGEVVRAGEYKKDTRRLLFPSFNRFSNLAAEGGNSPALRCNKGFIGRGSRGLLE